MKQSPRPAHFTSLVAVLGLYLLLTVAYSIQTPLFEAPDEQLHYFTAQTIAETGRLPAVGQLPDGWMGQEAAQPPLYYLLSAVLISPIDTSQAGSILLVQPLVMAF
jgi:hypothetical protein